MKWFLILIVTVLFLISGAISFVVFNPRGAWDLVGKRFVPADLKVEWRELKFTPTRVTWFSWKGSLEIDGLQVIKGDPEIKFQADKVAFEYTATILFPRTHLNIHQLGLKGGIGYYASVPSNEKSPEQSPAEWADLILRRIALFHEYVTLETVAIEPVTFELRSVGAGQLPPPLITITEIKKTNEENEFTFATEVKQAPWTFKANGTLAATALPAAKNDATDAPSLIALHYNWDDGKKSVVVNGEAELREFEDSVQVIAEGPITIQQKSGKLVITPDAKLKIQRKDWTLSSLVKIAGLPEPYHNETQVQLDLQTPQSAGLLFDHNPSKIKVSSNLPILSVKPELKKALNRLCKCEWPERRQVDVLGQAWLRPWVQNDGSRDIGLDVQVKAEATHNALLDLELGGAVKVFKEGTKLSYQPGVQSSMVVKSFQGLREILQSHGVLIPAPLDVLDGTITLRAQSPVVMGDKGSQTDVTFETQLKSPQQALDMKGKADLNLNAAASVLDVGLSFDLQRIILELPPLDPILGMPKMAADSRVQLTPPVTPNKNAFKVNITVAASTASAGALKFLTPYADPNIPITLDAKRTKSGDLVGAVKAEPFKIQYLKRVVSIETLRVVFDQREDTDFSLDGRVRFDATQYRVWADISGTLKAPSIRLRSEPELSQSDIISVLLYDRVSDQLITADRETANSFEAAMVDRAIGLFGLWAFASTPIRSFQYNPVTRVYTATVQVTDDVTAGIGTNWESSAQLELRKRVSRQWVLSASYAPGEQESQVGKLVLQWEKRF